jgi:Mg2+ and Co2+ transporter CorA
MDGMDVYRVSAGAIERHQVEDLKFLLTQEDGFVWVDIPVCDEQAAMVLSELFGFHPLAIQDCHIRTHIPKVHTYTDHLFIILHAPEPGIASHIHLLELDQFVGQRYLVTVHGPLGAGVPLDTALRETYAAQRRIEEGRYRPSCPAALSYTIVSALARRMETLVSALATRVAALEREIMTGPIVTPEQLLEVMFQLRHELLTFRTIAAHSCEVYARLTKLAPQFMSPAERLFVEDLTDQFDRVRNICDGEQAFLQGVIDFYQTRTITKLNIAMERLALISALLLPVTAVASIYGMNIIVFPETNFGQVVVVLAVIVAIMVVMFRWVKRQGWW